MQSFLLFLFSILWPVLLIASMRKRQLDELKEVYDHLSKIASMGSEQNKKLTEIAEVLQKMIDDTDRYGDITK